MKGPKPNLKNVIPMKGDEVAEVPSPPDHMTELGAEIWVKLAPIMSKKGRLEAHYQDLFRVYCEAAGDVIRFTIKLDDLGFNYTAKTRNGIQEKKRADWGQRQEAIATLARIGALFGMSPVDEARLSTGGQGDMLDALRKAVSGDGAD